MKQKQTIVSCLIVAMALGTAWAVRGKFGHEQGAAWAGAIGSIALILVTSFVGGLVGGFAAMTGSYLFSTVKPPERSI